MQFQPKGDNQFDGIIKHLLKTSNGDISSKVQITFSSMGSGQAINVTHYDKDDYFETNGFSRSYICFQFKGFSVVPTNYQIKSSNNGNYPKSWDIEGSNDESNWVTLAQERGCSYLNGQNKSHVFSLYNDSSKSFSFIRMRLTDPNWKGNDCLAINSFELYGSLN
ncbi:hypothetical protein M9Y10_033091 [Tritrichomonas musculus]|uniref:F5/8 type C domain-containing protein n=1 Tax=Tritrichomonas musculus TaxID=1915356 RepID=A0ABR2GX11_9EUKA